MNKKARIKDIAKRAGVSLSTVSRVIHSRSKVSPEVRARVEAVAEKLGINLQGRNKRRILGYLFCNADLLHPFQTRALIGAEDYCSSHEYSLLILQMQYSAHSRWRDIPLPPLLQRSREVGGFILAGMNFPNLLELLSSKKIPFAALGDNVVGEWSREKYDVVSNDLHQGAYEATRHLVSLGHQNIWFIGNTHLPWFEGYLGGYQKAMSEHSLSIRFRRVESVDEFEIGYLGAKGILRDSSSVSALFPGTDQGARGVYRALREMRLRIPEDISVVACNDTEAGLLDPPLTSVREFPNEVGSTLARLVIDRIEYTGSAPRQEVVPIQLVKRESSSFPREISLPARNLR